MPGVGFPRSPRDTRKTQDTPIPAVLGKTLTGYPLILKITFFFGFHLTNALSGYKLFLTRVRRELIYAYDDRYSR